MTYLALIAVYRILTAIWVTAATNTGEYPMSMLLAFVLAGQAPSRILPEIDRRALEVQARAEAQQTRGVQAAGRAQVRQIRPIRLEPRIAAPARQAAQRATGGAPSQQANQTRPNGFRTASANSGLDLSAITTICRAAGNQPDPANFLATLSRAYSMSPTQSSSLRTSCAAYLAGRADARSVDYVPAH